MAISQFPPQSGGGTSSDFVVDLNDTTNNVADLGESKPAGAYAVSLSSGDTSFDIYLLDANGSSVGYSNQATIVATADFSSAVVLGAGSDEVLNFTFVGTVSNTSSEGDAPGAGAYLSSITPTDLPSIDDTTTLTGGNFASDVEIYFESGEISTVAKNVVRSSSTSLIVTRPDTIDVANEPWSIRAVNPGVPAPTGSNAHVLSNTVTVGSVPVWVTTSPLTATVLGSAYSETLSATDAEGSVSYSVTSGSLPSGLSLESSTGVISGTTDTLGTSTFTVTASDDGGNSSSRQFTLQVLESLIVGADSVTRDAGYVYNYFNASGTAEFLADLTVDFIQIGGGGSGGNPPGNNQGGGGGGAGQMVTGTVSKLSGDTISLQVGGASSTSSGIANNSSVRGGRGGDSPSGVFGEDSSGSGGGAGGGLSGYTYPGGEGGLTNGVPQGGRDGGFTKGNSSNVFVTGGGGGGGQGSSGSPKEQTSNNGNGASGGNGYTWLDGITRLGGGGGGGNDGPGAGGSGGGGEGRSNNSTQNNVGLPNTGSGGGGGYQFGNGASGGSGIIVLRYQES